MPSSVVRAPVEVDITTVPAFGRLLDGAVQHARGETIEVDMSAMEFIDAAGLGLLVSVHKRACDRAVRLRLTHVSEKVMRKFVLTGLDAVFDLQRA